MAEHEISTDLHVKNNALSTTPPIEFQALFHNYIRAPSSDVRVSPLLGLSYYDKTEATEEARATPKKETRQAVDVLKFTDSVYENAPGKYDVLWGSGGIEIVTKNLKDVVIWNPQAEAGAKIGDMEEGGWYVLHRYPGDCTTDHKYREKYICVEPGYVRGFVKLEAGQTWIGHQVLKVKV